MLTAANKKCWHWPHDQSNATHDKIKNGKFKFEDFQENLVFFLLEKLLFYPEKFKKLNCRDKCKDR